MKSSIPIIPAKYNCIKASGRCQLREHPDSHFECDYENYCPWREDDKEIVPKEA